jgi:hypothetical protein
LSRAITEWRRIGRPDHRGIDEPQDIKKLDSRLELITELRPRDMHAYSRMPWWSRALVRLMDPITALRRMNRILLYRF